MNRQQLVTQARREFWENKLGFFYAPLIVTALLLLIMSVGFIKFVSSADDGGINFNFNRDGENIQKKFTGTELLEKITTDGPEIFNHAIEGAIYVNTSFLAIVFLIVILGYAHSCLFDDRKNRDILFWRSMPISETTNVLVKLGFILFYFPLVILVLNVIVVALTLIGAITYFAAEGLSIGYLLTSIIQSDGFFAVGKVLGMSLIYMFLLMPVIGFIFLASAYAKKSPFVTTSLIPAVLLVMDKIVNYLTGINLHIIDTLRSYRDLFLSAQVAFESGSAASLDMVSVIGYLVSMIMGVSLISAAIWMRNNRYEI